MGATITKGTTFTNAATAGGMAALVEAATIASIDRSCVRQSEITLASQVATPVSNPYDREAWETTPGNQLGSYDLASLRWRGALPSVVPYTLVGSANVTAGQALASSGSTLSGYTLNRATDTSTKIFGIALADCIVGAKSLCVISGPALAKIVGTITAGMRLALSANPAGSLQDATLPGGGGSWEVVALALLAGSGGFAWVNLRR